MRLWGNRRRREADLDEEIQSHLAIEKQNRLDRGDTPAEAEAGARRDFGNLALIQEVTRGMWGWTSIERLGQDARYALRAIRRSPGFALAAVLCLALGIGANTATFSLADALLLRPLPVRNPSEIVVLGSSSPENSLDGISYPDFLDIRDKTQSFSGAVAYGLTRVAMARSKDTVPRMKMGLLVSSGFLSTLGVQPATGRPFTDEETGTPGREPVIMLSYEFWRSEFGGDRRAIGSTVRLNGIVFTIIGVMPENWTALPNLVVPSLYLPITMLDRLAPSSAGLMERRDARRFPVKARLRSGVTKEAAQAEMTALARSLEQTYPEINRGRRITVRTELEDRIAQAPPVALSATMLMVLAALVLIIACANIANLLLARSSTRAREMAIRLSIGAGRARLFQQLLTESIVLSLIGGAAGLLLARVVIRGMASLQFPTDTPLMLPVQVDARVMAFALIASLVSAIVSGLAPAWRSLKTELTPALKAGNLGAGRPNRMVGRNALVTSQVALSLVLLVATGASLDAFRKMMILDPGIRVHRVMMMEFDPSMIQYTPDRARQFYQQLITRTRELPGIRSATLTRAIPFRPNFTEEAIVPEGFQMPADQHHVTVSSNVVDEDYFRTTGVEIVQGRAFTSADTADSRRVAVVNQEFVRRYWPAQQGVGRRFQLGANGPAIEVVGVARTGKYLSLAEAPQPYFYLPFAQNFRTRMSLLVATEGDPLAISTPVLEIVRSLDPNQPVFNVRDLLSYFDQGVLGSALVVLQMVGSMGLVGVALTIVGLYGLVAYSVSRRTREIGIRMALGADRRSVLRLVLGHGLGLSLVGVAVGFGLSVPMFRLLNTNLTGLGPLSPWTLLLVPCCLVAVTLAACYLPALRASRIHPNSALRYE